MAVPKEPTYTKPKVTTTTNPLGYLDPRLPKAGGPNTNVGSGSYPDLMLSASTGGAITDSSKYTSDVDNATQQLAAQQLASQRAAAGAAAPVGSGAGAVTGGSDPYALALQQAMSAYGSGRSDLLSHERSADSDLAQIFARTNQAQRLLQSHAIQGFHDNRARIGSTYDDLLGRINSSYGQGASSVASELKRLGLQEAGAGATNGLIRDAGFANEMAGADRANALTNNDAVSTLIANLMSGIRESTTASGASARAQNKISTTQALSQLAQQLASEKSKIAIGRADGTGPSGTGKKAPKTPEEKALDAQKLTEAKAKLEIERLLKLWPDKFMPAI